ncbi:M20 metallopeptidase family protein [Laceyella tengchongensis]|uniref:M20 metallopeptidase family protein n=1 Tax=Laceyella tengchongensis TaxID=574699 RepID=UPI0012B73FF2|nr:amidohydrolase [Laceyella tengchongensis]
MEGLKKRVADLFPQMVEWRRDFHQHPELSFQEQQTQRKLIDFMESCGLEVKTGWGGYGVTGLLRGAAPGPTIALRADMDALPIQDEKTVSYRSQVTGVMHACGHDGHMTMLMGAARLLTEMRDRLAGNVLFLFQHAEELLPGGSRQMIEAGVLEGVDAIFGIHLWTPHPVGTISLCSGELMAAADSFEVEIIGKGGHGGLPHEATDAVVIAAHVITHLQTIISRQVDPLDSGVISVGAIEGGNAFNVIAERCRMKGTVRSFNKGVREALAKRVEEVVRHTCHMFGADYRFQYGWGYPPLINHEKETQQLIEVARQVGTVQEMKPIMGGEDFAYYLEQIPGAFCFVGAGNPDKGITAPHHHPRFDIDEEALKVGTELFVRLIAERLGR